MVFIKNVKLIRVLSVLFLFTIFLIINLNTVGCSKNQPPVNDTAANMKNQLECEMSGQSEIYVTEIISNTMSFTTDIVETVEIQETETEAEITTETETETTSEIQITHEISEIPGTAEASENIDESKKPEKLYVITPSGKKYHYPNCRTVKTIKQYITKEEAEKQGYEPCKICKPD